MSIKAYGTVTVINVDDGIKGDKGDTGATISSVTPMYYLSTSNTELKGGSWSTTKPEITTGKYLFTKQVTTLTDGATKESIAVYDATITGIESRVSNTEQNITNKVWQTDINTTIATAIDNYDNDRDETHHTIRDRVTQTETDINGISSTVSDLSTTVSGNTTSITNLRTEYNQTAQGFNWLVQRNDQTSSYEITSDGIEAITNQFIVKDPNGSATIISGGRIHANAITTAMLATDAIKSTNYRASSIASSPYSGEGSFFNLSTGSIETPNFAIYNATTQGGQNAAYINGEIIATSGRIGGYGEETDGYWEIGNKVDASMTQRAAIISHGNTYIQSGMFMLHDRKVNTQSFMTTGTRNGQITFPTYSYYYNYLDSTESTDNTYYDYGMQAPQVNSTGNNNLFLYGRRIKASDFIVDSSTKLTESQWETYSWDYFFKIDRHGNIYTNGTIYEKGQTLSSRYASISGVDGAYLPKSGGIIDGDLTVNEDITLKGDLLDSNNISYFSRFVKTTDVIDVAHGGTGTSTLASGRVLIGNGTNSVTTRAIKNNTSVGTLGWESSDGNGVYLVTLNTLKNWNGKYNNSTSSLEYWKGGQFGTMANESASNYLKLSGGTVTGNLTVNGTITGNVSGSATSLATSAGSANQPVYFSNGIPVATTYSLYKTVPNDAVFTDTNYYHTSGTWNGLTYTATANGGADAGELKFTIPTGTSGTTVAIGNHTHSNYASKITLAGTDHSVSNNVITISKDALQNAVQGQNSNNKITYVLMTSEERSKLNSIQVSEGGSIGFSDVIAVSPLNATNNQDTGQVTISHNISGVTAGTYKSVMVDTYGHVTAGSNPTTLSEYGIIDAKIENGIITLGSNTITPLTASSTLDATKLSGTASINTTGNAGALTNKTLNSTTINNTAGSFTFEGSGDPWASTDWVGLQVGSSTDKFQLHASNSTTLEYRQNDNGGTNATWNSWYSLLSSGNYTDYTVTKTGSGASGTWGIGISGNAATATKATQDSDGNAINSTYLKLSGGTMTASAIIDLTLPSSAATWKTGRDKAKIRMSTYGGYVPIASIKTTDGSWDIAPYSENIINFTYVKDTTYSGSSNVYDARIKFTSTGGIDAMGTVAVGSHAVLTYNSAYNCLEFSFV